LFDDEAVAVALEAALPEAVPLPEVEPDVGAVVGAGDATSKEYQIECQEQGLGFKIHTSRGFDLELGALCKHVGCISRVHERYLIPRSRTKCHVGHSE
jgi:hypothetical protein